MSYELTQELIEKVNALPPTWMPRREQPEWDRDFNGRDDIRINFAQKTGKAAEWVGFAVAFSETIMQGFALSDEGPTLAEMGSLARTWVHLGTNQGLD